MEAIPKMILDTNRFHQDGSLPTNGEIFVFGSNRAGVHGAGAAKIATNVYGAKFRVGEGLAGSSYALPTKDVNIKTLNLTEIRYHIERFVDFTKSHPEMRFFITSIGCGLAGYQPSQVGGFFSDCDENCNFPHTWYTYV